MSPETQMQTLYAHQQISALRDAGTLGRLANVRIALSTIKPSPKAGMPLETKIPFLTKGKLTGGLHRVEKICYSYENGTIRVELVPTSRLLETGLTTYDQVNLSWGGNADKSRVDEIASTLSAVGYTLDYPPERWDKKYQPARLRQPRQHNSSRPMFLRSILG